MKMTATIELEFESAGETTHNAMDTALIRGLEALKKGIEPRATGTPQSHVEARHPFNFPSSTQSFQPCWRAASSA